MSTTDGRRKYTYIGLAWLIIGVASLVYRVIFTWQTSHKPQVLWIAFIPNIPETILSIIAIFAGVGIARGKKWANGMILIVSSLALLDSLYEVIPAVIMYFIPPSFRIAPVIRTLAFALLVLPLSLYTLVLYLRNREDHEFSEKPAWKRNKAIAILLAVFLGPWTWLYTYRRDAGKAAFGLGVTITGLTLWVLDFLHIKIIPHPPDSNAGEGLLYSGLGFLMILFAVWLAAVIFAVVSKEYWLYGPDKRVKRIAVLVAAFAGLWTWFYTYKIDYWKFWASLLIIFAERAALSFLPDQLSEIVAPFWEPTLLVVWVVAIATTLLRKDEWYQTFGGSSSEKAEIPPKISPL